MPWCVKSMKNQTEMWFDTSKAVMLYYRITDYDTQIYSFPQANNSTSYRYHTFKSLPSTLQQMFLTTCLYTIYSFATDVFTIILVIYKHALISINFTTRITHITVFTDFITFSAHMHIRLQWSSFQYNTVQLMGNFWMIKTHGSESQGQEEAGHTWWTNELFIGSIAMNFINALNKPPLKLSLSYQWLSTF